MAILENEVIIDLNKKLLKHFENIGYPFSSLKRKNGKVPKGTKVLVKVEDLPKGNTIEVTKICDDCGKKTYEQSYSRILSYREKFDGKDRCHTCGSKKAAEKRVENVPYEDSLENFSLKNNKRYLLDEYSDKNEKLPSQVFKSAGITCFWNCLKCESEYDLPIYQRTLDNNNCPYCAGKRVNNTNCVWTTHPEVAKFLKDKEIGFKLTAKSGKKVEFICPDCEEVNLKTMAHITDRGFSCSRCSDGLSYPEKFMIKMLSQLEVEFETQKTFNWSKDVTYSNEKLNGKKKYDFYIPSLDMIIETHGGNHYNGKFKSLNGKNLEEEQENDRLKEKLAIDNGIKDYVIIDCLHSNAEYIRNSITSSILLIIFDLNIVNWKECHSFSCKSSIKEICNLWENGLSRSEIEKAVHLSTTTVIEYLKNGHHLGWCSYNAREEMVNSNRNTALKNSKKVIQFSLDMEYIKEFKSLADASKLTNTNQASISKVCNGKQKTAGGFRWLFEKVV